MTGIHAKCFAVCTEDGHALVCWKSKGHTGSQDPKHREHYDPSADVRWTDDKEN